MDQRFRIIAGVFGAAGAAALVTQVGINMARDSVGLLGAIWFLASFFTLLTNTLVATSFVWIAATGRRLSYDWMSTLTVSMIMVGGVYHAMLAHLHNFEGLSRLTDQMFHTIMPAMVLWFWLMETTRNAPRRGRPLLWLAWPAVYAVYMLVRGAATGWYPYPFFDPALASWGAVTQMLVVFMGGTAALAFVTDAIGQRMPLRPPPGNA